VGVGVGVGVAVAVGVVLARDLPDVEGLTMQGGVSMPPLSASLSAAFDLRYGHSP